MITADARSATIRLLDTYLTYLACANRPLKRFDKALLMTPEMADLGVMTDGPVADLNAVATDLDCAWTVKILAKPAWDGDDKVGAGVMSLYENRTIPVGDMSRFRDRMPNGDPGFYDCFSRHSSATVFSSGVVDEEVLFAAHRRSAIKLFDPEARIVGDKVLGRVGFGRHQHDGVDERCVRLCMGTAFLAPMYWMAHVAVVDTAPRVTMLTDPTGVKELWKFRDIPEGAKRRDALLHWVSEHWRKDRHDPEVERYVRAHLRGSRSVRCSGLSVEISESSDDRERIIRIMKERTSMRYKHIDSRRRTRRP